MRLSGDCVFPGAKPGKLMSRTQALNELLARARLSDKELKSRGELAVNPAYWRELCPKVPVDSSQALIETQPVDRQLAEKCANQLSSRGYFKTDPLISESTIRSMRECVDAVRKAGWPPVFAFVYDPFWAVTRIPFMDEFLSAVLGAEFNIIMSRSWCYYIPPARGAGGWTPHADDYSRPAHRLTTWIPLTDATLDNGCIYVVPKDLAYGGHAPKKSACDRAIGQPASTAWNCSTHAGPSRRQPAQSSAGILRQFIGDRNVTSLRSRASASDVSLSARVSCRGLMREKSFSPANRRDCCRRSRSASVT